MVRGRLSALVGHPRAVLAGATAAVVVGAVIVVAVTSGASSGRSAAPARAVTTIVRPPATSAAPPTTSTTTTAPADTAVPSATIPVLAPTPTVAEPTAQALSAATGYLAAREAAPSATNPTATAWLDQAKPFLTPAAYTALVQETTGGSAGYAYAQMHQAGWKVATTSACMTDLAASTPTATAMTLVCTVTDQTVTTAGQPVAAAALPSPWALDGTQPPAILDMSLVGTSWLVAADRSGQ